jgi:Flp pilus assembly protein TadD
MFSPTPVSEAHFSEPRLHLSFETALKEKADQLEEQWLTATDAFGKFQRGDYERAIATFSEWITLNNTNYLPYVLRGFAYESQGKKDLARADYARAASLAPRTASATIRRLHERRRQPTLHK